MTKLMDYITEEVHSKVAIRSMNPPTAFKPLSISDEKELVSYNEAIKYKLSIAWQGFSVCRSSKEIPEAKHRLLEQFKYAVYKDIIELLYELRDNLHNYETTKAFQTLEKIIEEIKY